MRKWLVEETGEVRCPMAGEYYASGGEIKSCGRSSFYYTKYPILRVTEIVDMGEIIPWEHYDHPLSDRFDEWNW